MEIDEKLRILGESAKYDASCSSSGSKRANSSSGIGNASLGGVCHAFSSDGRCISLLKVLQTNICIYDCAYCVNRRSNDIPRAAFTPEELAGLTINFYKRNYIEGLFLSSGIIQSPDYTMELMIKTVKKLRHEYNFNGYIHMKAIPGASADIVEQAGGLVDRMSVNIELPSEKSLLLLAPGKTKESVFRPMSGIKAGIIRYKAEKKRIKTSPAFVPAGQSTQLIIGASPETDLSIMKLSESLYNTMNLKRVYYSAYVHVNEDSRLPMVRETPLLRENRIYQADWLLRFYGFKADEILDEGMPYFDKNIDPKAAWALRHLERFPVEANKAEYEMLLRVPGIGVRSAARIIRARKVKSLETKDLKKLGVVLKRAKYFLVVNGKYAGDTALKEKEIKLKLLPTETPKQMPLFEEKALSGEELQKTIIGEL
jgi:putative DNA modification/repair radical SAM protein